MERRAFLKLWTNRSANPFVEGWYGTDVMCLMPLCDATGYKLLWNPKARKYASECCDSFTSGGG